MWKTLFIKSYNLNVTEVRDSDLKNAFPGIFNFTVRILDFIGSDGDARQVQWCEDTFWISCKAWSTWKRSKPEITAPDKYLKDQDNTSDLKLPLRFSNSNATFVIEITFDEDGHQDMADDDGEVISGYQSETNLFWHLGLSTERTFI